MLSLSDARVFTGQGAHTVGMAGEESDQTRATARPDGHNLSKVTARLRASCLKPSMTIAMLAPAKSASRSINAVPVLSRARDDDRSVRIRHVRTSPCPHFAMSALRHVRTLATRLERPCPAARQIHLIRTNIATHHTGSRDCLCIREDASAEGYASVSRKNQRKQAIATAGSVSWRQARP